MKVLYAYSIYNGLELLDKSIEFHRLAVKDILICYQKLSNTGIFKESLEKELLPFSFKEGVHLYNWEPDLSLDTKQNELNKHNAMLEWAKERKYTHIIMSAADHFYRPEILKFAINKSEIYDVTFTNMYTYYKHCTWQLYPIEDYLMPLLIKIYPNTRFERMVKYPVIVDPALKVNTCVRPYIFTEQEIMMHHFSMVRYSIKEKFQNAASPSWDKIIKAGYIEEWNNYDIDVNIGVKYFQGRKIRVVPDYFGINM